MTDSTLITARYGTRTRRDRVWIVAIAVIALASFGGWAWWAQSTDRRSGIEWVAYDSTNAGSQASITWHLTAPAWTPVTCALRTVGSDMSTNGWLVIHLPGTNDITTSHTRSIRAVGAAHGVDVYSCWRTEP